VTLEDGLKFFKELSEMPYDISKVGQVFGPSMVENWLIYRIRKKNWKELEK